MLRNIATLLLFFLAFGMSSNLYAEHIIGGNISYRCLGNGDYEITMKIYRDCAGNGALFDSQTGSGTVGTITVYRGSSSVPFIETINLDAPEITRIQPDLSNPCLIVPPGVCVQEGVYRFTLTLPESDQSYHIVYQRCCRNNTINNILQPGSTGSTFTTEITPKAQEICNNSPVFDDFPPIVICQGEPLSFDHSATDPDGNTQLVYEFCSPLDGGGLQGSPGFPGSPEGPNGVAPNPDMPPPYENVDFAQPQYTFNRPMGGDPLIQIDPNTGMITGTPDVLGQFVVGVCVKEYLNGELLSVTRRDFQFNVAVCEPTVFADIEAEYRNGDETFVVRSCGEKTVDFINESYNQQYINEYLWSFEIEGEKRTFNSRNVTVEFPEIGQYEGTMILNPDTDCSDTAQIEVNVYPEVNADFEYSYDTCKSGPVRFFDQSETGADRLTDWQWQFGDGDTTSDRNPIHKYQEPGNMPVTLTVQDENRCVDDTTQNIPYFPVPDLVVVDPSSFRGCAPARLQFMNLSTPIDSNYTTNWQFGDGGTSDALNPYHTFDDPGLYTISLEIISPIGCKTSRTYRDLIRILESPAADFTYSPEVVNSFNPTVKFTDQSENAVGWQWDFSEGNNSFVQNPTYTFQDTGLHTVTQTVFHPNGCTDSISKNIDVIPEVTYYLPNAFSPNGDGTNDEYLGKGILAGIRDFQLTIWNRYGEKVFETSDPTEGWNGQKHNTGEHAPQGVYVCIVRFIGPRGKEHRFEEFATLIR